MGLPMGLTWNTFYCPSIAPSDYSRRPPVLYNYRLPLQAGHLCQDHTLVNPLPAPPRCQAGVSLVMLLTPRIRKQSGQHIGVLRERCLRFKT